MIAAVVFTVYFGFIQFRGFKHSIELVRGDYLDPNDAGEVTPFQALATALSARSGSATSPVSAWRSISAGPARRFG